jgi:hypothetical protein
MKFVCQKEFGGKRCDIDQKICRDNVRRRLPVLAVLTINALRRRLLVAKAVLGKIQTSPSSVRRIHAVSCVDVFVPGVFGIALDAIITR